MTFPTVVPARGFVMEMSGATESNWFALFCGDRFAPCRLRWCVRFPAARQVERI
jgi:hypothetical protein